MEGAYHTAASNRYRWYALGNMCHAYCIQAVWLCHARALFVSAAVGDASPVDWRPDAP